MRLIKVLMSRKGKPIDFVRIQPAIDKFCQKHQISLLYLFGSYSSGKMGFLSDVDIAYLGNAECLDLMEELTDIFEDEAIDIVDLKEAPPLLTHHILKGRCLYAKTLATKINFESHAEAVYFDTAPLRRTYFKSMLGRINDGTFGY